MLYNKITNEHYYCDEDARILLGREKFREMRKNGELIKVTLKKKFWTF